MPCSGPVSGLFIVNTDATTYSGPRARRPQDITSEAVEQGNGQIVPVPIKNPELATNVYDEVLLWKFLSYFSQNAGGRVWTARLPSLVAAKNRVAMRTAARAVSLAFAAQNVHNPSMARIARECYGTSLRYHQFSFKAPTGKNICQKKAVNALPVTVLLSYYEMIHATSPDAWLKHTLAAERLFVLLGSESLSDPLLNHLFFIVRANAVIRCILDGTDTKLVDGEWSKVRMLAPCGPSTVTLHALIGLNSRIWRKLNRSKAFNSDEDVVELNTLWIGFAQELGFEVPLKSFVSVCKDLGFQDTSFREEDLPQVPNHALQGGIALTESFFHAAAIMVLTFMGQRGPRLLREPHSIQLTGADYLACVSVEDGYLATLQHHAGRILALSHYQRSLKVGCACLRMVLPLTVVSRYACDMQQCVSAQELFRNWCDEDGLPGLAEFTFGQKGQDGALTS